MRSESDSEIIVIAADSAEAVSRIHRVIGNSLQLNPKTAIVDLVLSAPRYYVPSERVCVVLLELNATAAQYPDYCLFVGWCLQQASLRDEFRLCITAVDSTALDETTWPIEHQELLRRLKDTVQETSGVDLLSIGREIAEHVANIETIRKRSAWRRFQIRAAKFLGAGATLIQSVCFIVAIAAAFWLPVWDPGATLGPYERFSCQLTMVCEIAGMPLLVLLIYSWARYGPFLAGQFRDPRGVAYAAAGSLLGPPIIMTPVRLHVPLMWIVLGGLLGCMVESIRRMAGRFRRANLPLGPENITNIHERLPVELRREYTMWLSPRRIPLMPVKTPRVFISYSRSSSWACDTVRQLSDKIRVVGTDVFTDIRIDTGENWRRRLNYGLADSTVVLALVDEVVAQRQWPASEVEASLRGRRLAGLPEMIVVVPAGMEKPSDESWKWLPIYRELLSTGTDAVPSVEVVEYKETTAQALSFRLHSAAYRSPSMIPAPLAPLVEIPWRAAKALLLLWSAGCGAAGLIAMVLVVLAALGFDSGSWLAKRHWCAVAAFGGAAWAAAAFRHALGAHFELLGKRAHGVMTAHRAGGIGLVILVLLWLTYLSPAQIAWVVFIAYCSYLALDEHWKNRDKSYGRLYNSASGD